MFSAFFTHTLCIQKQEELAAKIRKNKAAKQKRVMAAAEKLTTNVPTESVDDQQHRKEMEMKRTVAMIEQVAALETDQLELQQRIAAPWTSASRLSINGGTMSEQKKTLVEQNEKLEYQLSTLKKAFKKL